jgi:hypothetical protein
LNRLLEVIIKDNKLGVFVKNVQKNKYLRQQILCQEMARMQDFVPSTPEVLGS